MLTYVESFCSYPMFYVGCFSYTPPAVLSEEFFLHAPCCVMWGVSLTPPLLFYVGSFSYMPHAVLCGEFLLHVHAIFMLFYVGSVSYTPNAFLCGEFLQHAGGCFTW